MITQFADAFMRHLAFMVYVKLTIQITYVMQCYFQQQYVIFTKYESKGSWKKKEIHIAWFYLSLAEVNKFITSNLGMNGRYD